MRPDLQALWQLFFAQRHRERCTGRPAKRTSPRRISGSASASAGADDDDFGDLLEPSGRSGNQRPITQFVIKGQQLRDFVKNFALSIITSETPFRRVNNYYLKKALDIVGVDLPDESTFRTTLLAKLYEEAKAEVDNEIQSLLAVRAALLIWVVASCMRAHCGRVYTIHYLAFVWQASTLAVACKVAISHASQNTEIVVKHDKLNMLPYHCLLGLFALQNGPPFMLCSDGWRKRAAGMYGDGSSMHICVYSQQIIIELCTMHTLIIQ